MADSIDEFFAKKDKSKKGKAKSKYTTSETIAKKLEEGGKEKKDPILKKDNKDKIQISSTNQSIIIPSIVNDQVSLSVLYMCDLNEFSKAYFVL